MTAPAGAGRRRVAFGAAALMLWPLGGCGPVLQRGTPLEEVLAEEAATLRGDYLLLPGDQIDLRHVIDPAYSAIVTLAPDGKIAVPGLRGQIEAAGLSLDRLHDRLEALYRREEVLRQPYFSLTLHSSANLQVFVGGEVQRPGLLDFGGGERRVLQVIAAAGGFLATARSDEVIIIRTPAGGKSEVFSVNLDAVLHGTDLAQNVRIHPLDVVMVPRSDAASFDKWIDQHIRQALPLPGQGNLTYTNNPATSLLK